MRSRYSCSNSIRSTRCLTKTVGKKRYKKKKGKHAGIWTLDFVFWGNAIYFSTIRFLARNASDWYLSIRTNHMWEILTKKRKQHPSQGDDESTAGVAPGRVGRDEHGEARRANRTPNGGPHLELERSRLKPGLNLTSRLLRRHDQHVIHTFTPACAHAGWVCTYLLGLLLLSGMLEGARQPGLSGSAPFRGELSRWRTPFLNACTRARLFACSFVVVPVCSLVLDPCNFPKIIVLINLIN